MARSIGGEACFGACAEEFSPCRCAAIPRQAKFPVTVGARCFACPLRGSAVFSAAENHRHRNGDGPNDGGKKWRIFVK
jgi:hypothetical protein